CVGRRCTTGGCPPGTMASGGTCVATSIDPENCGMIGNPCRADQLCDMGGCVCRPGLTLSGTTCWDTQADPDNCGTVGNMCRSGELCVGGSCLPMSACAGGALRMCPSTLCPDLNVDPLNCGMCGNTCLSDTLCVAGNCQPYRPAPACTDCAGCDC